MGSPKKAMIFMALFIMSTFCIKASLNSEQKKFIALFSLSREHTVILDSIFTAFSPVEFIKNLQTTPQALAIKLLQQGFSILKLDVTHRTVICPGRTKLVINHPLLPDFILKAEFPFHTTPKKAEKRNRNLSRILTAHTMRTFVEANHFGHIIIPRKYLYHLPGTSHNLVDSNYLVVAEKMTLLGKEENRVGMSHLSAQQIGEVFKTIQAAGYYDAHLCNICLTHEKKITFIDTEDRRSHWDNTHPFKRNDGIFKKINGLLGKARLYSENMLLPNDIAFLENLFITFCGKHAF